jgi:phosphoglycerate kinase
MAIKSIENLELAQRRVLIRVDFNVPQDKEGNIVDDTRIRAALPTIKHARDKRAKVILMSHFGRPKGGPEAKYSLQAVGAHLAELLEDEVVFPDDCVGDGVKSLSLGLKDGQVMLLENLRFHKEEEAGDEEFGRKLAALGNVYVNDAFGTMHRAHASIAVVPKYVQDKAMGFLVAKEYGSLSHLLAENTARPYVAVLGGAKVSDKIGVIKSLLSKVNVLVIGGAMANTFLAAQGVSMGKSLVEAEKIGTARSILDLAREKNVKLLLPVDHVVTTEIKDGAPWDVVANGAIPADRMSVDVGPETLKRFIGAIAEARTLFWNGPVGVYENAVFRKGTEAIARAVSQISGFSVVGGGDSVAAVGLSGVTPFISHISTGGGASLEFIEGQKLPGFAALEG